MSFRMNRPTKSTNASTFNAVDFQRAATTTTDVKRASDDSVYSSFPSNAPVTTAQPLRFDSSVVSPSGMSMKTASDRSPDLL